MCRSPPILLFLEHLWNIGHFAPASGMADPVYPIWIGASVEYRSFCSSIRDGGSCLPDLDRSICGISVVLLQPCIKWTPFSTNTPKGLERIQRMSTNAPNRCECLWNKSPSAPNLEKTIGAFVEIKIICSCHVCACGKTTVLLQPDVCECGKTAVLLQPDVCECGKTAILPQAKRKQSALIGLIQDISLK